MDVATVANDVVAFLTPFLPSDLPQTGGRSSSAIIVC